MSFFSQCNVIFTGAIFNKHAEFFMILQEIYDDSNEIIHVVDELNWNKTNLLESNRQHAVQCFAVDEEIEHCKYHLCIIGAVQMMLMLPSA